MTVSVTGPAAPPAPLVHLRVAAIAMSTVRARVAALVQVGGHYLLVTWVLSTLWLRAGERTGGSVAGYSGRALVWYIATTELTAFAVTLRLVETVGDDLRSGRYELELLRPRSALWTRVASETGASLPRLALLAGLGLGFATLRSGGPPPVGAAAILTAPSLVLAIATAVVAQHLLAAAVFWLRDVRGTWFLYQKLQFTLGGLVLPLELLPGRLAAVARLSPFAALSYTPGRLASGHAEPGLVGLQVVWLAVLSAAATRLYAAGERRLTAGAAG